MSIAANIKSFHKDIAAQMNEAEERAVSVNQDWDNESTEYDFADGSVLIVCNNESHAYGSR